MGIGKKKSWEEQERQKLADLYRYHQKSMMQIAMSILHRKEDAEDAVQNRDRKSTRLNSSHTDSSRMPSSA